jgi:putative ABC transport system permease protein
MSKKPGFTLIAVLTLALGIGATTAMFSIVSAILLRPLPFYEPDRLTVLWSTYKDKGVDESVSSYPNFEDWRRFNQVFEDLASFEPIGTTLGGVQMPERVPGARVSASFFPLLHVNPIIGRTFLPEEDNIGSETVVILSDNFWKRRFAADRSVIGQKILLDGIGFTVVGVLPPGFSFPVDLQKAEVWENIGIEKDNLSDRTTNMVDVIGRLKPGVSLEAAQADMDRVANLVAKSYPAGRPTPGIRLVNLREQLVGSVRAALWVLLGSVGFVLAIACSNIANLLLAQAGTRKKEIAVRVALGAKNSRVVRQLLTESALLAITGALIGLPLAIWGTRALTTLNIRGIPQIQNVQIDLTVLGFTCLVSLLSGVMFGLAPALSLSRPDLNETLKEGGRSGLGNISSRSRAMLIIGEIALTFVLLVGAGLLIKSFIKLQSVDTGFVPSNLLTARISLPESKYTQVIKRAGLYQQILRQVETLPGVESAALVSATPFSDEAITTNFKTEGSSTRPVTDSLNASLVAVSPAYFSTMHIPLKEGREFNDFDSGTNMGACIIDEAMSRQYWPGQDPIGKVIYDVGMTIEEGMPHAWQIVGIVENVKATSLKEDPAPTLYLPYDQQPWSWAQLVIRTKNRPSEMASTVGRQIASIDSDVPLYAVQTMEEQIAQSVAQPRFYMLLLIMFAVLALALSTSGVYGVLSYLVSERTHEIGIRLAIGATPGDVLMMFIKRGIVLATAGLAIGLIAALAVTRLLIALLYSVSPLDPSIFALITALLMLVVLAASYFPAWRAAKVDPAITLRYQ